MTLYPRHFPPFKPPPLDHPPLDHPPLDHPSHPPPQLSRNDWYRLHRALVVAIQTQGGLTTPSSGVPSSGVPSSGATPEVDSLETLRRSLDLRCFFLTASREPLCRRIDRRCGSMLRSGLLEETTEELLQRRLLPSSTPGRAIGYRQSLEYLLRIPDEYWAPKSEHEALTDFVEGFAQASRRYAAQQTKWFRSEPRFAWVPVEWSRQRLSHTVFFPHMSHFLILPPYVTLP